MSIRIPFALALNQIAILVGFDFPDGQCQIVGNGLLRNQDRAGFTAERAVYDQGHCGLIVFHCDISAGISSHVTDHPHPGGSFFRFRLHQGPHIAVTVVTNLLAVFIDMTVFLVDVSVPICGGINDLIFIGGNIAAGICDPHCPDDIPHQNTDVFRLHIAGNFDNDVSAVVIGFNTPRIAVFFSGRLRGNIAEDHGIDRTVIIRCRHETGRMILCLRAKILGDHVHIAFRTRVETQSNRAVSAVRSNISVHTAKRIGIIGINRQTCRALRAGGGNITDHDHSGISFIICAHGCTVRPFAVRGEIAVDVQRRAGRTEGAHCSTGRRVLRRHGNVSVHHGLCRPIIQIHIDADGAAF